MNILIATFWVSPHVGGVWIMNVKENLELLGHNVDLFAWKDHEFVHNKQNKRIDKNNFLMS